MLMYLATTVSKFKNKIGIYATKVLKQGLFILFYFYSMYPIKLLIFS